MKKSTITNLIIIVLVVLNITTLLFFTLNAPHMHQERIKREKPRELIINKLKFNKEQIAKYDLLIQEHRKEIVLWDQKIKKYKKQLYKQLKAENASEKESLLTQIATAQAEIESLHYNHFLAIKKICQPHQLESFNQLTEDLAKLFEIKPPKDNPKPIL